MTQTITLFRCRPHTVDLTRTSCGQRYESMNRTATRTPPGPRPSGQGCVGCLVGKAHASGERVDAWPDGQAIAFTDKAISVGLITPSKPKAATAVPRTVASGKALVIPDELKVRNDDARTAAARARFDELAKSAQKTEVPVIASDVSPPPREDGAQRPRMTSPPVECVAPDASPSDGVQGPRPGPVKLRTSGPLETREVEVDGKVRTVAEWATITGITISAVKQRIQKGMTPAEACTSPRSKGGRTASVEYPRAPAWVKPPAIPPRVMPGVELEVVDSGDPIVVFNDPPAPVILPVVTPEIALRAAGWEVVSSDRVPAGWMLIVRETGAPPKKE